MKINPLPLLQRMKVWQLWLLSVILSVLLAEAVVVVMGLLLKGEVPPDYLLTGLVASSLVAALIAAMLSYFLKKLTESRLQLHTLIEAVPECLKLLAADGTVLQMNRAGLDMIEADSLDQIIGQRVQQLVPSEYRDAFIALTKRVFEGGPGNLEFEIHGLKGSHRWVNMHAVPLLDSYGQTSALLAVTYDITERKAAERTLAESEERFRLIMETIEEVFWMADISIGRIYYISPGYERIWGRTPQSLYKNPRSFIEAIHPEDMERVLSDLKVDKVGQPFSHEYRIVRPDGTIRWVWNRGFPVRDKTGKAARYAGFALDITERRHMEEALKSSEAFTASILNSLTSHIAVLDEQGIIVMVNQAWQQFAQQNDLPESNRNMLGCEYLKVCEKAFENSNDKEIGEILHGIQSVIVGEQQEFHTDYPCHSANEKRWFHMNVTPLQGSRRGVVVSHETITERKLMEDALKASEAKFRSIIEISPVPMALYDQQSNTTFLNPAFVQTFGYGVDDIPTLAEWWTKAYPDPDYRHRAETIWHATLEKAKQEQTDFPPLELAIHCKDNSIRTVLVSVATIHHELGDIYLMMLYDISQRKQMAAKLDSIFNASVEGIITIDTSDIIVSANTAVETIFGYKPEELIGCSINKLMHPSPKEMNGRSLPHTARSEGQIREIEGMHKNGSVLPLDLSIAEFSIENAHYFTHIVRDVSLRKYREQQDKKHLDELAHVTRLGLMGEMASGIAHEVNQPLTAISNYAQVSLALINSENPDLAKLTEILYKTQQQALRAGQIILRMREFLKSHVKHRSTADINILIHDAVSLCVGELKQNDIKLTFKLENNLPPVYVDQIQIEQVLINLIRNSVDALQGLPKGQQRQLAIHSRLTLNDAIQVRVKDNGPGLNEEQRQKISTPFYTTKADGMGMGLSISRSIIEAHEGSLHFNSQPGKGATFYFTLPVWRKSDED